MKCPSCGFENLGGVRFCNYCGKEFTNASPGSNPSKMIRCQNCGFNNIDGSIFCNQCGKDLRVSAGPTVASPLSNTRPCSSCGRMIPIDANICPYCRFNFKSQPAPIAAKASPQPTIVQTRQSPGPTKTCISCGRIIPTDANICPYCRYNYRAQLPPPATVPIKPTKPVKHTHQPQRAHPAPHTHLPPAGLKPCVSCGKTIPADANICPYCMYKYR